MQRPDVAFVEPLGNAHDRNRSFGIASEDGALHRCGAAPTRKVGEVDVDHRDLGENMWLDDLTEGHYDSEVDRLLGVHLQQRVDLGADRDSKTECSGFDRCRRLLATTAASFVFGRYDHRDLVPGGVERLERGNSQRRGAKKCDPSDRVGVRWRKGQIHECDSNYGRLSPPPLDGRCNPSSSLIASTAPSPASAR